MHEQKEVMKICISFKHLLDPIGFRNITKWYTAKILLNWARLRFILTISWHEWHSGTAGMFKGLPSVWSFTYSPNVCQDFFWVLLFLPPIKLPVSRLATLNYSKVWKYVGIVLFDRPVQIHCNLNQDKAVTEADWINE